MRRNKCNKLVRIALRLHAITSGRFTAQAFKLRHRTHHALHVYSCRTRRSQRKRRILTTLVLLVSALFIVGRLATPESRQSSLKQAAYNSGIKQVAVLHEMIPNPDQGGNIRIRRIINLLVEFGFSVRLYVRKNIEMDTTLTLDRGSSISVLKDDLQLTRFLAHAKRYELVISCMWFWNHQSIFDRTIPIIVHENQQTSGYTFTHVAITDDIHHVRFAQTDLKTRQDSVHSMVRRQEIEVWCSEDVVKVFVSNEDMYYARSHCPVTPGLNHTFTVVPYMISPSAAEVSAREKLIERSYKNISRTGFKLAYIGKAHPGNILAMDSLSHHLLDAESMVTDFSSFWIIGDDHWSGVQSVKTLKKKSSLEVHLLGELDEHALNTFLGGVHLLLAPVVTEGTGIASKIFKSIELGLPFVSTYNAKTGFQCDFECEELFFVTDMSQFVDKMTSILYNRKHYLRALGKLKTISYSLSYQQFKNNPIFFKALLDETVFAGQNTYSRSHRRRMSFQCGKEPHQIATEVCEMNTGMNITLSVYMSLLGTQREKGYIKSYVENAMTQDFADSWEIVVGSIDAEALMLFRDQVISSLQRKRTNAFLSVRTVLLPVDEGLYETWDVLVRHFTGGTFLTNWNVDDRKHETALSVKVRTLRSNSNIDVVSSATYVSYVDNENWQACSKRNRPIWHNQPGFFSLSSFIKTQPESKVLVEPQNYPHNAPVYRRSVHSRFGYFSDSTIPTSLPAPACADWKFWFNCASRGAIFYNLPSPLEVYLARPDSHNRRPNSSGERCVQDALKELVNLGLYNNVFQWGWPQTFQYDLRKDFLITSTCLDVTTTTVGSTLTSTFIKWLIFNEHSIFCPMGGERYQKLLLTGNRTFALTNAPQNMQHFDFLLCDSLSNDITFFGKESHIEAYKVGISKFPDRNRSSCEHDLHFTQRSSRIKHKSTAFIGTSPHDWVRSKELMNILHPLLTNVKDHVSSRKM